MAVWVNRRIRACLRNVHRNFAERNVCVTILDFSESVSEFLESRAIDLALRQAFERLVQSDIYARFARTSD